MRTAMSLQLVSFAYTGTLPAALSRCRNFFQLLRQMRVMQTGIMVIPITVQHITDYHTECRFSGGDEHKGFAICSFCRRQRNVCLVMLKSMTLDMIMEAIHLTSGKFLST